MPAKPSAPIISIQLAEFVAGLPFIVTNAVAVFRVAESRSACKLFEDAYIICK